MHKNLVIFYFTKSGGVVEFVPCSHIAHIYRGPRTESQHPPGSNPFQLDEIEIYVRE